jgi:hypothetical protein
MWLFDRGSKNRIGIRQANQGIRVRERNEVCNGKIRKLSVVFHTA